MQNGPSYNSSAAIYPEKSARTPSRYFPVTCCSAFFSPGLHPVLDSGEGDEHAVVSPEMPTGSTVRQTVLHDQPHCQRDDAMRVVTLGECQLGRVCVEVALTFAAIVLRVSETNVPRASADQIPHVVQRPLESPFAIATVLALRTRPARKVPAAYRDFRLGQVFNTGNSLGSIRQVLSRSSHGHPLVRLGPVK